MAPPPPRSFPPRHRPAARRSNRRDPARSRAPGCCGPRRGTARPSIDPDRVHHRALRISDERLRRARRAHVRGSTARPAMLSHRAAQHDVAARDDRTRVAGQDHHGGAVDPTERDRLAGPHRDAPERQLPGPLQHDPEPVLLPHAGPAAGHDQVRDGGQARQRVGDAVGVVRASARLPDTTAAERRDRRREQRSVGVADPTAARPARRRPTSSSPVDSTPTRRPRVHAEAGNGRPPQPCRSRPAPCTVPDAQHQVARPHVLAPWPHEPARPDRHPRRGVDRHRAARSAPREPPRPHPPEWADPSSPWPQCPGPTSAATRISTAPSTSTDRTREAVHRGVVEGRDVVVRGHVVREHQPQRVGQRHLDRCQRGEGRGDPADRLVVGRAAGRSSSAEVTSRRCSCCGLIRRSATSRGRVARSRSARWRARGPCRRPRTAPAPRAPRRWRRRAAVCAGPSRCARTGTCAGSRPTSAAAGRTWRRTAR